MFEYVKIISRNDSNQNVSLQEDKVYRVSRWEKSVPFVDTENGILTSSGYYYEIYQDIQDSLSDNGIPISSLRMLDKKSDHCRRSLFRQ